MNKHVTRLLRQALFEASPMTMFQHLRDSNHNKQQQTTPESPGCKPTGSTEFAGYFQTTLFGLFWVLLDLTASESPPMPQSHQDHESLRPQQSTIERAAARQHRQDSVHLQIQRRRQTLNGCGLVKGNHRCYAYAALSMQR